MRAKTPPEHELHPNLKDQMRMARGSRDLERINQAAGPLNAEAADVLDYQLSPE